MSSEACCQLPEISIQERAQAQRTRRGATTIAPTTRAPRTRPTMLPLPIVHGRCPNRPYRRRGYLRRCRYFQSMLDIARPPRRLLPCSLPPAPRRAVGRRGSQRARPTPLDPRLVNGLREIQLPAPPSKRRFPTGPQHYSRPDYETSQSRGDHRAAAGMD